MKEAMIYVRSNQAPCEAKKKTKIAEGAPRRQGALGKIHQIGQGERVLEADGAMGGIWITQK